MHFAREQDLQHLQEGRIMRASSDWRRYKRILEHLRKSPGPSGTNAKCRPGSQCLIFGVDRTYRKHHETDASDPRGGPATGWLAPTQFVQQRLAFCDPMSQALVEPAEYRVKQVACYLSPALALPVLRQDLAVAAQKTWPSASRDLDRATEIIPRPRRQPLASNSSPCTHASRPRDLLRHTRAHAPRRP